MAKKTEPVKKVIPKKRVVKSKDQVKAEEELKTLKQLEDFEYICQEIEKGAALRNICSAFMSTSTFYNLIETHDLSKRYARACERRADAIFEDMIDIADASNADLILGPKGNLIIDGEAVGRSRLKVETRKWMVGKMNPKKYGDKMDITTDGDKINPVDLSKLDDATLSLLLNGLTSGEAK